LIVLLPGTFGVSLIDRDEGWYAQVSREMLASGDWLIPHYLGQAWIAKPPLLYWCVSAAYAVFRPSAWAGRLVSVLATVGAVQLLGLLAARLYNRRVALIASMSFITAGLPAIIGKMLLTDGILLLCCLAATVLLWTFAARGPRLGRAVGFWACVGLAVLTKGPAVVLFVGAFGVGLITQPETRGWLRSWRLWLTSPVALAVAAPWYLYAAQHEGGILFKQFFWYEIASRVAGTPHGHGGPPGYYLLLSLAGWLPWTALVPGAVIETWRARRKDPVAWLLLVWFGLPWIVLELIPSKLPHYILPCYVPLAIMLGRMWDLGLQHSPSRLQWIVLGIWVGVPTVLGAGLITAAVGWRGLAWAPGAATAGAVLLAGFIVVAWRSGIATQSVAMAPGRLLPAWGQAVCVTAIFHVLAGLWALPGLEPYRLSRLIAERANALLGPQTEVLVCGYDEPSMFFYLDRPGRVIRVEALPEALEASDRSRVIIVREDRLREAGLTPGSDGAAWQPVRGFNYVKARRETVWIARLPARGAPE
jgi:4-amino-4-deoxy-L-arabinose transferase-like glycosyltransferase